MTAEIPDKELDKLDKIIQDLTTDLTPKNKGLFTKSVNHLLSKYGIEQRSSIASLVELMCIAYPDNEGLKWALKRAIPSIGDYWNERSGVYGWYKESQYQAVKIPLKISSEHVECPEKSKSMIDGIWWRKIPVLYVDFYGFGKEADYWRGEGFSPALEFPYWYTKDEEGKNYLKVRHNLIECGFAEAAPYFEGCKEWYRNVVSKYYVEED